MQKSTMPLGYAAESFLEEFLSDEVLPFEKTQYSCVFQKISVFPAHNSCNKRTYFSIRENAHHIVK